MISTDPSQQQTPAEYLDLTNPSAISAQSLLPPGAPSAPDEAEKRLLDNATTEPIKNFNVQKSGTDMSVILILAIVGLALLLFIAVSVGEFGRPTAEVRHAHALLEGNITKLSLLDCEKNAVQCVEVMKEATELVKAANDGRRTAREFWMGFTQLLLINLLLPVLTALLGYVFGTRREENVRNASS